MKNASASPGANGSPKVTRTVNVTGLLKAEQKADVRQGSDAGILNEPFTEEQLREAWNEFAGRRRNLQAEHQMLSQPYSVRDKQIIVTLLSPVHDTMLNNIKIELTTFLREKLKNSFIQVSGELTAADDKKIIYTNREKFEYLAARNPLLKELKDRLGLDTDY